MRQALGVGLELDFHGLQDFLLWDLVGDELQNIPKQTRVGVSILDPVLALSITFNLRYGWQWQALELPRTISMYRTIQPIGFQSNETRGCPDELQAASNPPKVTRGSAHMLPS